MQDVRRILTDITVMTSTLFYSTLYSRIFRAMCRSDKNKLDGQTESCKHRRATHDDRLTTREGQTKGFLPSLSSHHILSVAVCVATRSTRVAAH